MRIDEQATAEGKAPRVSNRFVTVVVARGTEELVEAQASVWRWLIGLTVFSLLAASGVALLVVSRGLRSTRALAAKIARLDATRLDSVLPSDGLPGEIEPVVTKINQFLARLRDSFAREKRFTADVSHELRTPLAGLRTTLEVAASRDRTAPEYRAAIEQARVVVLQMQALCENLLALARVDAGLLPIGIQEVDLRTIVQECWCPFEARARERVLTFRNEIEGDSRVASDPDQLRVIVSNLLSNAVAYTSAGGTVLARQEGGLGVGSLSLEILNSGPPISDEVLPHLFERFFRGSSTRSASDHWGIGLALVRGISDALGLRVIARNTADGGVSFAVRPL